MVRVSNRLKNVDDIEDIQTKGLGLPDETLKTSVTSEPDTVREHLYKAAEESKTKKGVEDYTESNFKGLNMPEEVLKEVAAATSQHNAMRKNMYKAANKDLKRGRNEELNDIIEVAQKMDEREGISITADDLREAGYREKTIKAWEDYMEDYKTDYILANQNTVGQIRDAGYKMSNDGDFLKEINHKAVHTDSYGSMAIKFGDEILTSDTTPANALDELFKQGYKLYQLHPFSQSTLKRNYTMVLTKDAPSYSVPDIILPHKNGGHRVYDKRYRYAKVGDTIEAHGKRIRVGDKILTADMDLTRLDNFVKDYNNVMDIYNTFKDDLPAMQRALKNLPTTEFNIKNAADLKKYIKSHNTDTLMKAKVTKFDESLIDDTLLPKAFSDAEYNPATTDAYLRGNKFLKAREGFVRDLDGRRLKLADVSDAWELTIERAVHNATLHKLFTNMGETFKEKFAAYIDVEASGFRPEEVSGLHLLQRGIVKDPAKIDNMVDKKMASAAINMQKYYQKVSNIPTPGDMMIHRYMDAAVKNILPRQWHNNKFVVGLAESNPLKFLQAVSYRASMGMFNLAQIWKQGPHTLIQAFGMHPIAMTEATAISPGVATALYFRKVKGLSAQAAKMVGMSEKDFDKMLDWMDRRGTISKLSSTAYLSLDQHRWATGLDTIFLNMSNNASAIIIDTASFLMNKNKTFEDFVFTADKMMLFPDRYAIGQIQRGLGGFITQWLHYPMRWLELMKGDVLTRQEKVGLLLANLAAYGVSGTFLGRENTLQVYQSLGIEQEDIYNNPIMPYLADGIITTIAAEYGYDIREGVGIGDMIDRLFRTVNFMSEDFGVLPEVPASAVVKQSVAVYQAVKELVAPSTGVRDLLHFWRIAATTPYMIPGLKNAGNFMLALDARGFYDKNGDILEENVSDRDAVMSLFGIKSIKNRALTDAYNTIATDKENIEDIFNKMLKPSIDQMNTYYRTRSLPDINRDSEESQKLYNTYLQNKRAVIKYVSDYHPSQLKYLHSLINRAESSGRRIEDRLQYNPILREALMQRYKQLTGENR